MKKYYEAHITFLGHPSTLRPEVEKQGWRFSTINGDPVLGEGIKCYATTFFNARRTETEVIEVLHATARIFSELGHKVIRRKIELVLHDDRSRDVPCEGSCLECHG